MLSNYVEMFSYFEPLKDGLFLADDGECYTCTYGTFDNVNAECVCSEDDNKVANSDANGCECADGYLMVLGTGDVNDVLTEVGVTIGDCVICDNTAPLFDSFVLGQCTCKAGAILNPETGVCECAAGFMFWEDDAICVACHNDETDEGIAFLDE